MAQKCLEQFCEIILQDSKIQDQLNASVDQASFIKRVVQIANNFGFNFTAEEIQSVLSANQTRYSYRPRV